MLVKYNKNQKKIAMGLMSFHKNKKLKEYENLLKSVDWYEEHEGWKLYFWKPDDSDKVQGIIGGEWKKDDGEFIVYDLALNPSMRGEGYGFNMLNDLQKQYPDTVLVGTKITKDFIETWKHAMSQQN